MSGTASTDGNSDEIDALRAQVADLKAQVATGAPAAEPRPRRRWGRGLGAVALLIVAGILLPCAVSAVWADRLVGNTDRYVQTVSPLAEDPEMQAAITNRIVTELDEYVDVEDLTEQALGAIADLDRIPPRVADRLTMLSGPISSGIDNFVQDQVAKIVASPQFATAWDEANRLAHEQVVAVLTGKGTDTISVDGGTVSIQLGPFISTVKQALIDRGFGLASNIPTVNAEIVLVQSQALADAQTAFQGLNTTAWLLPLLVLLLLAAAVFVAPSRRLGFVGVGVAVTTAMLVALAALSVGRIIYLREIPGDVLPGGAAGSVFDILTRFLKEGLLILLAFGVVTIVAAVLAGPSRGAVAVRRVWVNVWQSANHGLRSIGVPTQPVAEWVERYALALRVAVVVVAAVVLVAWDYPTGVVAFWIAVGVLVGLAVIDFLRAPVTDDEVRTPRTTEAPVA